MEKPSYCPENELLDALRKMGFILYNSRGTHFTVVNYGTNPPKFFTVYLKKSLKQSSLCNTVQRARARVKRNEFLSWLNPLKKEQGDILSELETLNRKKSRSETFNSYQKRNVPFMKINEQQKSKEKIRKPRCVYCAYFRAFPDYELTPGSQFKDKGYCMYRKKIRKDPIVLKWWGPHSNALNCSFAWKKVYQSEDS